MSFFSYAKNEDSKILIPQDKVIACTVKRLASKDGKFPAPFVSFIGQQLRVDVSSQMSYEIVNPSNNQKERQITVDIVDENGGYIGWTLAEVFDA